MTSEEIVQALSQKVADPAEVVYAVTMRDLLAAIEKRMGDGALQLTQQDLLLASDEVRSCFEHYLDEREIYALALDQWDILRVL